VQAIRGEGKDKITGKSVYEFLVTGYAPDGSAQEEEHTAFWASIDRILAHHKRGDKLVVSIDTNASVGRGPLARQAAACGAVGPFGMAHINAAGRRLRTWMETHQLASLASFYRKQHYGTAHAYTRST